LCYFVLGGGSTQASRIGAKPPGGEAGGGIQNMTLIATAWQMEA
jgi:hypothetical protein